MKASVCTIVHSSLYCDMIIPFVTRVVRLHTLPLTRPTTLIQSEALKTPLHSSSGYPL
jgi:hypothetical protein